MAFFQKPRPLRFRHRPPDDLPPTQFHFPALSPHRKRVGDSTLLPIERAIQWLNRLSFGIQLYALYKAQEAKRKE